MSKLLLTFYLNKDKTSITNKKTLSKHFFVDTDPIYSKTKIVRRCIFTGRSRGSVRKLGGVSRVLLRDMLQLGIIPGYKKAVW